MLESLSNKITDLKASRPETLLKRDSNKGLFSYQYCKIFKNSIFYRLPPVAAFEYVKIRGYGERFYSKFLQNLN